MQEGKMLRSRIEEQISSSSSVFAVVLLLDITSSVSVCVGGSHHMNSTETAQAAGSAVSDEATRYQSLALRSASIV